ncbi:GFA family protein [Roseovarius sp. B08]|uniref:GFA family protein n=1 Tax=Roseovarius sp. B08 TaxID=3449223 RepID=UPI003EDBDE71
MLLSPILTAVIILQHTHGMKNDIATCGCGKAQVTVTAMPSSRFRCHCTICQNVYASGFADVLVFRRGQVKPVDWDQIKWTRTKSVTPLRRGLCIRCNEPVIAHFYGILAFMPARTLPEMSLPKISKDIYYDTRISAVLDDVPKSSGLIAAYASLTIPFLKVLLSPGRPLPA